MDFCSIVDEILLGIACAVLGRDLEKEVRRD